MKRALIIGVTGQDGSLLAKNLVEAGLEVHGTFRRGSSDKFWRINELAIREKINFHIYNVGNELAFSETVKIVAPDVIFSLAGESFTALSFEEPKQFMTVNIESTVEPLEAIRKYSPEAQVFFAGSSEVFGQSPADVPLDEFSKFNPKTPYGVSKVTQSHLVRLYREKYSLNLFSGILFPHESEFRSSEFVTRKITMGLAQRKYLNGPVLQLGDLSQSRDWGSAVDFVDWMHKLITTSKPDEYVFGTGQNTKVEDFLIFAGKAIGLNLFKRATKNGNIVEYINESDEIVYAIADSERFGANRFSYGPANPTKLMEALGNPRFTTTRDLAVKMIETEVSRLKKTK